MIKQDKLFRKQTGFSLVEMAVVLTIVGVLLGGLLPMLSSQVAQQRRTETVKYMNEVRDALLGFAVSNGRLPCPDTTNDGTAEATCTTTASQVGTLPYKDLGITDKDSYNNVLIYAVTKAFADSTTPFTLNTNGTMRVCTTSACTANLTSTAVAVIVSRGEVIAHTPAISDETENTDGDTDFVSHDLLQNGYDDLVVWLSRNTLSNRMVAAGKLP